MPVRSVWMLAIAFALVLMVAAPLQAGQRNGSAPPKPEALGGANAQFARVALVYDPTGGIVRSKGVAKVTNPMVGVYCIKTEINVAKAVANVSVEWYNSSGYSLLAFWETPADECPNQKRWLEVRTYTFEISSGTDPVESNEVAFSLTVP